MYTDGNVQKLPIENIRIVYMTTQIELEIIMKEEENGWVTTIPIFNGKQGMSFTCIDLDAAINETKKRYNLKDLTAEDFKVMIESTDYAGVAQAT